MRENVTQCFKMLHSLTDVQQRAIEGILAGYNDSEIAAQLRVHRITVGRWRAHHPEFRAELNRRREIAWSENADRLRAFIPKVLDQLESSVRARNTKTALAVLKIAVAFMQSAEAGPMDSQDVVDAIFNNRVRQVEAGVNALPSLRGQTGEKTPPFALNSAEIGKMHQELMEELVELLGTEQKLGAVVAEGHLQGTLRNQERQSF